MSETSFGAHLVTAIRAHLKAKNLLSLSAVKAPAMADIANLALRDWQKLQKPKMVPVAPMKAEQVKRLFTALCDLSGINPDELTNDKIKRDVAVALTEIRRATPAVEETEIRRRAALYLKAWPGLKFTALGLSKHWSEFSRGQPVAPKVEAWHAECPGWRELLADTTCRVQDGALFVDRWAELSDAAKREAWKRRAVA